jgi:hypothetical protein
LTPASGEDVRSFDGAREIGRPKQEEVMKSNLVVRVIAGAVAIAVASAPSLAQPTGIKNVSPT